jgi:ABC-type phosphate transport system substrate-binding protein
MRMTSKFWKCSAALALSLLAHAAQADIVVVMGPGGTALSKDQLANIYLGRTFDLKPVDLPEGNATRDQFYKKATDRDPAQVKAVWSRIIFTGKGQAPAVAADAAAVKKAVAADPKGIGYIEKAAVDGSVKVVLTLD